MDDLTTFLRACLDDDERVARKCAPGPWVILGEPRESYVVSAAGVAVALGWLRDAAHIARWDPARVLAEIDAKRRIIDAYMDAVHMHQAMSETDDDGKWDWLFKEESLEGVVKLLALPYADLESYREEWRP